MKTLLNRSSMVWLASGVIGVASWAPLPVAAQPTDDDAPAPTPRAPAKTASKTAKTRKTATATARRTSGKPAAKTKTGKAAKATGKANVPAIFYDEEWSYRTATLYDKEKNIVTGVTGEAKFERNGKFRQDYYIGSIGNFFKGTYKIQGDHLITSDEKGKQIFDFKFTVGTNPPVLVLTLLNKDGSKSIDYSLVPLEKKNP